MSCSKAYNDKEDLTAMVHSMSVWHNDDNYKGKSTFYHLPTEIQITIFKLLNFQAFLTCRRVSQNWKNVLDSIQDDATWKKFLRECLPKHLMFVQKSKLPIYKVLKNMASMEMQKRITVKEVTSSDAIQKFHIYRDVKKCGRHCLSAENWKKVVTKCRKITEEDWERDVQFDNICEQEFIINLQDWSSGSETDSDMDLGCTPLRE